MDKTLFTGEDIGCYADGTHGFEYVNARAIELATAHGWEPPVVPPEQVEDGVDDLIDGSDLAVEYLNGRTADGLMWGFSDGDLMLMDQENFE
tara:strand:+ start:450 stop:725 length:276 start_codon:yes stop_codon:yes gene_type:complete